MDFRCISFHQSNPDLDLCRLAVDLGFNYVELQTENGQFRKLQGIARGKPASQVAGLRSVHEQLVANGKLQAVKDMGLKVVLWTREVEDHDPQAHGPIAADNDKLFETIRRRYEILLTETWPEADAIALTVAETSTWIDDPAVIARICQTVAEVCRRHGRQLIVRSFAYQDQRAAVARIMRELPDDVWLMTKYNPRDWHIRGVRDPLIGNLDPTREIVEEDIGGEYHLANQAACCLVDAFQRRFAPLKRMGLKGLTLRANRGWDMEKNAQGSIYGEAQEAHLWAYAAWMREDLEGEQAIFEPIRRWAAHAFGDDAPLDELVEIFRPTGEVLTEALYVGLEPFGDTRCSVPIIRTTGGDWGYRQTPIQPARRYTDAEAELDGDHGGAATGVSWAVASAFHHARSNHPHEPALLPHYHGLRRGDPRAVADKSAGLEQARACLDRGIARFEALRDRLPAEPYAYLRFKLERTGHELEFRGHAALAYLLGCQRLYSDDQTVRARLADQVNQHLRAIEALAEQADAETSAEQHHRGRTYQFPAWPQGMRPFIANLRGHFELPGMGKAHSLSHRERVLHPMPMRRGE